MCDCKKDREKQGERGSLGSRKADTLVCICQA